MIYKDPIRTLCVELPAGWVYDPFNTTLTDFYFTRWDKPEELIAIRIRRSAVTEGQSDEEWIGHIQAEVGETTSLIDMVATQGRAVAASFKYGDGWSQQVAFVRGARVDLAIEQRCADTQSEDPWTLFDKAVRTAQSDANTELPDNFNHLEYKKAVQDANLAFEKKDYAATVKALEQAARISTFEWLNSLASRDKEPDLSAAIRIAQISIHLGKLTGGTNHLRDADFLLRRVQQSLSEAETAVGSVGEMGAELSETLQSIWAELLEQTDPGDNEQMYPILAVRERGFRSTLAAKKAFDSQELEKAGGLAEAAVEDLLSLIAFWRRSLFQEIPEEVASHLSSKGITDPDDQKDAIQRARETVLFPPLIMAFQIRFSCSLERRDSMSVSEAVTLFLPVARLLFNTYPEESGTALNLALALLDSAGACALSGDDKKLDQAKRYLEEADRILEIIGSKACADEDWFCYHETQIEGSLEAIDAGLAPLHSQFVDVSNRFREALARCSNPK